MHLETRLLACSTMGGADVDALNCGAGYSYDDIDNAHVRMPLVQVPAQRRQQPATALNDTPANSAPPTASPRSIPVQGAPSGSDAGDITGYGGAGQSFQRNGSNAENGSVVVIAPSGRREGAGSAAGSGARVGAASSTNGSLTAAFSSSKSTSSSISKSSSEALQSNAVSISASDALSGEIRTASNPLAYSISVKLVCAGLLGRSIIQVLVLQTLRMLMRRVIMYMYAQPTSCCIFMVSCRLTIIQAMAHQATGQALRFKQQCSSRRARRRRARGPHGARTRAARAGRAGGKRWSGTRSTRTMRTPCACSPPSGAAP